MKTKVVLVFENTDDPETQKDIGYLRLLLAILGDECHVRITRYRIVRKKEVKESEKKIEERA